jgi:hypothetical protein
MWDDGDAVVCWSSPTILCVAFPTAATLNRLRDRVAADKPKLVGRGGGERGEGDRGGEAALHATSPALFT